MNEKYLVLKGVGRDKQAVQLLLQDSLKDADVAWRIKSRVTTLDIVQRTLRKHWVGGNLYAISPAEALTVLTPQIGLSVIAKRWSWVFKVVVGLVFLALAVATISIQLFLFGLVVGVMAILGHGARRF